MIQLETKYDPNQLIKQEAAAAFLELSQKTLEKWRHTGGGPRFVKRGSRFIRYRAADLIEWIEGGLVASTSEATARDAQHAY